MRQWLANAAFFEVCGRVARGTLAQLVEEACWKVEGTDAGKSRVQAALARVGDYAEGAALRIVSALGSTCVVETLEIGEVRDTNGMNWKPLQLDDEGGGL